MIKRLFLTVMVFCCVAFAGYGQQYSFYKVSLDSLVTLMNSQGYSVYCVADSLANAFTFDATKENLYEKALNEIKLNGYSVTDLDGHLLILKDAGISLNLPTAYFGSTDKDEGESEYLKMLNNEKTIASLQNQVYDIGRKDKASTGKVYLSGFIKNIVNGEPLVGASVYDEISKTYAQTDEFGFYKLYIPVGERVLKVSDFSFEDASYNVNLYETGSFDIMMKEKVYSLKVAVISSESSNTRSNNKMGAEIVRIGRIKQVPSVFGESDVMKVLLTLPGVKSVGEASGGLNVRGGASDQNLILYNGGTVFNPSHLFGMFSLFNPDVVMDVELLKSSIPAQYGGRISSVLDIRGREGNSKKITGSAGLGLLSAKFHLEGPLSDKLRFIIGARATYSDWMLNTLPRSSGYKDGTASFYDLNASFTYDVNKKNSIYAYGYYSQDKFKFSSDTSYAYHNVNASIKWRSNFSEKHNLLLQAGYDQYDYNTFDTSNPVTSYRMTFNIQEAFLRLNFKSHIGSKHTFNYGLNSMLYYLSPGSRLPFGSESLVVPEYVDRENALESALYFTDTWDIHPKFSTDLGIRVSAFNNLIDSKFYWNPEFRISAKYLPTDWLTVKAGFNSMTQYIHMLTNSASASPTDIWKLSDKDIQPQTGWQAALGLYTIHFNNKLELSLEGYYKDLNNYLDYKSGATLVMNHNLAKDIITTKGRAYGIEFMVKKPLGKLNGWMSYTYSKTELRDISNGESLVNGGTWYPAVYDKPHDFKLVGNYKFTHRFSISVNVDYATGRPVSVPDGTYFYGGGYSLYYSNRNSYRIPDYFRVDAAINIEPGHNLKKLTHFSFTIGVYNVTGRKNAYSVYYTTDGGNEVQGYKLCIFGAPIPYVNFNFKF